METHIALGLAIVGCLGSAALILPIVLEFTRAFMTGPKPIAKAPDDHCVFCWDAVTHKHASSGAGTCAAHAREGVRTE